MRPSSRSIEAARYVERVLTEPSYEELRSRERQALYGAAAERCVESRSEAEATLG